ncbi:MAG: hypothetical protein KC505_04830 [Myxococcales bacterium]|nr:hypothetical protein [Myxococcales bacterium]USN50300.1 MAG: hypothetical protein H6731_08530 [Myxococcales bacterium]
MNDSKRGNGNIEKIFDEIIEFLRQLGWPSEAVSKKLIRTFFKGDFGINQVIIHINTSDICMVIDPVVDRYDASWGEAVTSLIAAMSEEIQHIGVGLDDDGDLFVKVNLPHEYVNLERFHCLLLSLCQVAENMLLPVLQANAFDRLKAA